MRPPRTESTAPPVNSPFCIRAVTTISLVPPPSLSSTAPPANVLLPAKCPVIGIAGGVGSGKSAVVRALQSVPLFVIDADSIGHQQLLCPAVRQKLLQQFGTQIANASGEIDRPKLAAIVFGDSPEQQAAREQLNRIVRPGIRAQILNQLENIPPNATAAILDAALLLEAGWQQLCDAVIFVDTPLELRLQRVAAARGWSPEELHRREASQWPLEKKRAAASHIIDNSTTLDAAASQLQTVLNQILNQPAQIHR